MTIDLRDQTVQLHQLADRAHRAADETFPFEVPESHRHRLLNGLDAIAETLVHTPRITTMRPNSPPGFPLNALKSILTLITKIRKIGSRHRRSRGNLSDRY